MKRLLHNPSHNDITVDCDKHGENPETHTLKAGQIEEFDDYIADLIVDKLSNRMLWENYPKDRNRDKKLKELKELIEV
ncbi:MAG TPA: hypothetical protein ENI23_01030 [bacterium]|nr:hypothetical protein [bacterium]